MGRSIERLILASVDILYQQFRRKELTPLARAATMRGCIALLRTYNDIRGAKKMTGWVQTIGLAIETSDVLEMASIIEEFLLSPEGQHVMQTPQAQAAFGANSTSVFRAARFFITDTVLQTAMLQYMAAADKEAGRSIIGLPDIGSIEPTD